MTNAPPPATAGMSSIESALLSGPFDSELYFNTNGTDWGGGGCGGGGGGAGGRRLASNHSNHSGASGPRSSSLTPLDGREATLFAEWHDSVTVLFAVRGERGGGRGRGGKAGGGGKKKNSTPNPKPEKKT